MIVAVHRGGNLSGGAGNRMIRRKPLPRSTKPIARNARPKAKRAAPRRGPERDPGYLEFLRERGWCTACVSAYRSLPPSLVPYMDWAACGRVDPAHGPANGMGSKGHDSGAIPLGRVHHREQHRIGWPAFEAKYGIDREKEAAAHYALYLVWRESR